MGVGGTLARFRWGVPQSSLRQGGTPARSRQGVPQPGPEGGTPIQPRTGGIPARSRQGVPQATPGQGWGTPPRSRWGYPIWMGAPWGTHHLDMDLGWGTPSPPPPPPPVRTTEGVLASRQSVCLLCSRSRTFLFNFISHLIKT